MVMTPVLEKPSKASDGKSTPEIIKTATAAIRVASAGALLLAKAMRTSRTIPTVKRASGDNFCVYLITKALTKKTKSDHAGKCAIFDAV